MWEWVAGGGMFEKEFPLSLTQWLPKPATSQFPETGRSLRETWSPRGGEGTRDGGLFDVGMGCGGK